MPADTTAPESEPKTSPPPEPSNGALLRVEDLVKSYHGRRVVDAVSLYVKRGEIVGLLGPNGAGKTTTFYMIVGLIRPEGGRIVFDGGEVSGMPVYRRARRGMGYLSQEPSVFRKLTVRQNVMAILETLDLDRAARRTRCDALLRDLGLERLAGQRAYTLSGGERRKLEIARALVTRPSLMMLDEPFSGVDPLAVDDIQTIIAGLRDRGLGIVITDHNVRETLAVVDRAYLLYEGKVLREGAGDFLINDKMSRELYLGDTFSR
ncbi:MAG: LPS export ABC transporter ATP-binding protein [Lentisphaerae bacterium]|nr:LPS export ABC transporter ATP-binding protein [Lentisphaerota bacterium]